MGFFSFNTCDDEESIPSEYVTHKNSGKPVFLLQPNGATPIEEPNYEGYGVFGGVDVFDWLARQNINDIPEDTDPDDVREAGVYLDSMGFCVLGNMVAFMKKSEFFADFLKRKFTEKFTDEKEYTFIQVDNYAESIEEMGGLTLNELIEQSKKDKSINVVSIRDFVHITFPVKLSFDKNASYERNAASTSCEYQGYFYPEDDG